MSTFRIYNETLCPDLWDEFQHLDARTRVNLLRMAYDFYKKTKFAAPIVDVWLMGSIANYNWTPDSDVDVHIIIDFSQLKMPPETASKVSKSAGAQWNNEHEVTVKGHKVEINIQSVKAKKPYVTGIYSLVKDEWIRQPQHINPSVDKVSIQSKYSGMKKYIESAIRSGNRETMKQAKDYLDAFRQYGLDCGGELSIENIVYKILRTKGIIKMLKDSITATYDKEMTVAENENSTPTVYDYIGGIVNGEVRGERVPAGKVKSHLHIDYPGLYSGANRTNWRYNSNKNQVLWNLEPDPENKPMVDDFLFKRGIKSPTHKAMYREDKSSQPEVKSKNFRIQFGDPQVAKGAGIIYLGDVWFANTYKDHDKKMWLINRHTGAMNMKFPPINEWFYTPEGVLDYLEKWYNSRQKVAEIAFPHQIPGNSPIDNDISKKKELSSAVHAAIEKAGGPKPFEALLSNWMAKKEIQFQDMDFNSQSHILELFCRAYLSPEGLLSEVTQKDIKAHFPPPENVRYTDDRSLRLDRLTLDNLKSLRDKCVRSWEFHRQSNNSEGMKSAKEDFKYFDDELKKRMNYINAPVTETKTKPLPWYIDPSSVPLEQYKSNPYWISPNGNFYDAGSSHSEFAQMYLYPDAIDAKKEAIKNGWVRVRSHPEGGGIELEFSKLSPDQKKVIEKFSKSQQIDTFVGPDYQQITLQEGVEGNPFQDLLRSMPPGFGRIVKIKGNKLFIKSGEVPLMYVNFEPIDKAYSVLKFRKNGHDLVQDPNVKTFYDVKDLITYFKRPALGEGFGWGQHPEKDPLHIPGERWRIKWYNARKTPKMKQEEIDEMIEKFLLS